MKDATLKHRRRHITVYVGGIALCLGILATTIASTILVHALMHRWFDPC